MSEASPGKSGPAANTQILVNYDSNACNNSTSTCGVNRLPTGTPYGELPMTDFMASTPNKCGKCLSVCKCESLILPEGEVVPNQSGMTINTQALSSKSKPKINFHDKAID